MKTARSLWKIITCLVCAILLFSSVAAAKEKANWTLAGQNLHNTRYQQKEKASWTLAGQNLHNTRYQESEKKLDPKKIPGLAPKWVFTTGGDVSATPTIAEGALYVPDWAGNLFKIDTKTGQAIWQRTISAYIDGHPGFPAPISRTSPALDAGNLFVGTQQGAYLLAIDSATGDLLWRTQLDTHPAAVITQSPVVYGGRVYVGVSSVEEIMAALVPGYQCCTFRGSVVALDASTGAILWRRYTIPDNGGAAGGYAGNAVWGSTPVVDTTRGSLYITTGNNYDAPQSVKDCEQARQADPNLPTCIEPDNHIDAILALDLDSGAVKWSNKLQGYDAWTVACFPPYGSPDHPNCPDPSGPDYDFGQGVMLYTATIDGQQRDLLGAGQKSGIFWALDPDTGAVVWSTLVGPGGALGGSLWGSATDGNRIYVAVSNSDGKPHTLIPSGQTTNGGSWSALDAATGAILWQTADPQGAMAAGPVSAANGVVYAGSMAASGNNMYALDAATGAIVWGYASGGSVNAGAAVVDGSVYWGSGYANTGGAPNNKLYAFSR